MSDAYSEAISTDDSPAPPPSRARIPLLGDPHTEGNEHLLGDAELAGHARPDLREDDLHADLNNSDVQN
nr:hypothetical protein [Propionibacterium sp.]